MTSTSQGAVLLFTALNVLNGIKPELADANICEFFARRLSSSADFAGFSIREYLIITSLTFDVQSQLGFPH
jgi:hypothetical protein